MKPRITVITLGVDDLERTLRFYREGLGLPTRGIVGTEFEHGAVAFFDLHHGLKLAIWTRKDIAHEAKVPLGPRSATEFTLGHNVASKEEVDGCWHWYNKQARSSPIRHTMHSGAATLVRSKTPMGICGKSCGIRRWTSLNNGSSCGHASDSSRGTQEYLSDQLHNSRVDPTLLCR